LKKDTKVSNVVGLVLSPQDMLEELRGKLESL